MDDEKSAGKYETNMAFVLKYFGRKNLKVYPIATQTRNIAANKKMPFRSLFTYLLTPLITGLKK
jgi:hypothetical protein